MSLNYEAFALHRLSGSSLCVFHFIFHHGLYIREIEFLITKLDGACQFCSRNWIVRNNVCCYKSCGSTLSVCFLFDYTFLILEI